MKSIFTSLLVLCAIAINAQFANYYDPANWTTSHSNGCDNGYVDDSGAPASVLIVGSENPGCGSSAVYYGITVQACGTFSFNWDYTTLDCDGSNFDRFGYSLNGNAVQLTNNFFPYGSSQSGTVSIPVAVGDNVTFYIFSTDNVCGYAYSTISNLSGPACDLSLTINTPPTLYYGYSPLSCTQVTATATSSNGPVTMSWTENGNPGDGAVCATDGNCITVTVTATDAACCVATTTVVVQVVDATCYTPSGNPKVEICHNGNTICVAASSVAAHLAHGDHLGACGETPDCGGEDLQVALTHDDPIEAQDKNAIQPRSSSFSPSIEKLMALSADQTAMKTMSINPNPANDVVSVTVNRGVEGPAVVSVYNLNGQLMLQSRVDVVSGTPVDLNVSKLVPGNYTLRVEYQGGLKLTDKLTIGTK